MHEVFTPNPRQKEAIEHVYGPMLVLAGAGTGKTSVLVERIAYLIEQKHGSADEILAITFTDNAADELKQRVANRLRRKAQIFAGTFHAYCFGILKRAKQDFSLLLPEDVYVFLRQRIDQLGLERFIRPSDLGQFLDDLHNFFDRCHEELVGPEEFQTYVDSLQPGIDLPRNCRSKDVTEVGAHEIIERWKEIARVYRNSMQLLERENLGTFGMMIRNAVRLLDCDEELLRREREKARFILIDEFQDCNSSNIILAEKLAGATANIFAVGDPDQAIYRFRGASSAAFEEFQKRFPSTRGVTLEENQRSRANILRVAYAAVSQNPPVSSLGSNVRFQRALLQSGRDRRDQQAGRFPFDDPVEVVIAPSNEDEAAALAEQIEFARRDESAGEKFSLSVLYRQHLQREELMQELAARDIPFIVTGLNVLETGMARDLLAVARAICNDNDAESMFRVCALPRFGISGEMLRDKLSVAPRNTSFKAVMQTLEPARAVLAAVEGSTESLKSDQPGAGAALAWLAREFELPQEDPVVQALVRFASSWEDKAFVKEKSLAAFLLYLEYYQQGRGIVPLFTEEQMAELERRNPDAVQLMSVHAAKGLEFSHVWLLRVTSGAFPANFKEPLFEFPPALRRSMTLGDGKDIHDQEERRLFYVAITRARDRLVIGSRPGRGRDKSPAGFLRPMINDRSLRQALVTRDHSGSGSARLPKQPSSIAQWMLLPPAFSAKSIPLSANAVQSYSTCPMKFKLERDWKIPGEAAAAMQYGFAIHTVLKHYYDPAPHAQEMSADQAVEAFRTEFAKGFIEDPVQRKMYEERGIEQLRILLESSPRGSAEVIATEHSFKFKLGSREIIGRIDRMDRMSDKVVRVVDYKTGAPKDRKFAEQSLQLSIYAMAAQEMGFSAGELVLVNVQDNTTAIACRSARQLDTARAEIDEVAQGIASGAFDPKPGQHCRWCDYRNLCPATEQRVFLPSQMLVAEAEKAAGVNG